MNEVYMRRCRSWTGQHIETVNELYHVADEAARQALERMVLDAGLAWRCGACGEVKWDLEDLCCGKTPDGICWLCEGWGFTDCWNCKGEGERCLACQGRGYDRCSECNKKEKEEP